LPLLSKLDVDEEKAPMASSLDYIVSNAVIPQDEASSFVQFLPLRGAQPSSQGASETYSGLPTALLVAAAADGAVRLFTPSGEMVLTFSAGHEHPVAHLATSMTPDEQAIVTSDDGGIIRVHRINVRQRRLQKKSGRSNSTEEKVSQYISSQANVTMQFQKQFSLPRNKETGAAPKLTALVLASTQNAKYFVTGDEAGFVHIFSKNGSLRKKVNISGPGDTVVPVEGLYAQMGSLLFWGGGSWGFIELERFYVRVMECQKFEGRVTSAILDSQQSARVIAADENGTVWVLNARDKKNCKVEHRFRKGTTRAPISLASVRGFALGLQGAQGSDVSLSALNMSHVGKRKHEVAQAPSGVVWRQDRPPTRSWAVHKRGQQGDLVAFLSQDGLEIEVAELLMQTYTAPVEYDSFSNFQTPVIAVAVVLVLGYQYVKNQGKFSGGGSKGKGGNDWDSDLAAFKSKGLGGLGGGKLGGLGGGSKLGGLKKSLGKKGGLGGMGGMDGL